MWISQTLVYMNQQCYCNTLPNVGHIPLTECQPLPYHILYCAVLIPAESLSFQQS